MSYTVKYMSKDQSRVSARMHMSRVGSGHQSQQRAIRRRHARQPCSLKWRVASPATPPLACSLPVINRRGERKLRDGRLRGAGSAGLLLVPDLLQRLLDMARKDVFGGALVLQRDLRHHLALGGDAVDGDAQRLQRVLDRIHDRGRLVAAM